MSENYFYFEGKKIPVSDVTAKNIVNAIKPEPVTYSIGDRFKHSDEGYILAEATRCWGDSEVVLINLETGITHYWRKTVKDRFKITEKEFEVITNGRKFEKLT